MDSGKVERINNNNDNKNNKQRTMVVTKEELYRDQEAEVQDYCGAEPKQMMMGSTSENDNKNNSKKKKGGGVVLGSSGSGGKKSSSSSGGEVIVGRCCQAEMCTADLSDAKHYHRRHKVCEHHAKAQFVLVAGLRQRFCQQCSRFHELSEFDETRRSCRRRLAGHNERRRKSSTETHAAGSGRKVTGAQLKDMACAGQVDDNRGKIQIGVQENATYKHLQIR